MQKTQMYSWGRNFILVPQKPEYNLLIDIKNQWKSIGRLCDY